MTANTTPPWHEEIAAMRKDEPFDPLRLCIYATVALLGWLAGPFALLVFAAFGLAAYIRARRAGLLRSKCYLRDTRLVIGYLAALAIAAIVGIVLFFTDTTLLDVFRS
ncbi:hypothetical protein SAMN02910418_02156 [Bowdeniella nasicola]|uniref:Uncharacterized protein n=1 Tax=Bowdeniella nasicola TaxID=208480 RepID=A0A1H4D6T2_9ACTO|nr:hypothetical protein [Bowdeniella nasicola]SEA68139.1 hypothetical protein SAMN02910418_02156 [Bowdeniella nasicola]